MRKTDRAKQRFRPVEAGLSRRSAAAGVVALVVTGSLLGGCGGQSVTRRFRVIATVDVDGKEVEGSTVMEITYSRVKGSMIGAGGATNLKGEALILDLPGKGTVYVLPWVHVSSLDQVYEFGVLTSLGIQGGVGVISDRGFEKLRDAQGRIPFFRPSQTRPNGLPLFVAFENESQPTTIYEVDPYKLGDYFPGVTLKSFDIEFTDLPVTHKIEKRLAWLSEQGPQFKTDPPGYGRPVRDLPLDYKISKSHFFALGSQ